MFMLIRLGLLVLTRRWGWYLLGVILLGAGIIVGVTSHQVAYQTINKGTFTPYIVEGGTDYLQTGDGSTYYVVNESEFSPSFDGASVFKNDSAFTMIARTDTQDVDVQLTDGTHLQGNGYKVEQVVVLDSSGNPLQTYNDSEYTQNPNGFYENNWIGGGALIALGLLAVSLGLFIPSWLKKSRLKKTAPAAFIPQGQAGLPYPPNPVYLQQNPSYMQPNAYPQPNPAYQQPNPSYTQPNPYQQPYTNPSQYQQPYSDPSQYPPYTRPGTIWTTTTGQSLRPVRRSVETPGRVRRTCKDRRTRPIISSFF